MSAPRDQFAEVGRSTRAVMEAAAKATPPLKTAEWRVLTAVMHETSTWSRHTDVLSVARIGTLAGLSSDALIRSTLGSLRDRGLVVYQAQRGRPRAGERGRCRIGIPDVNVLPLPAGEPAQPTAQPAENRHPGVADNWPVPTEAKAPPRGGGYSPENRHPGVAAPEKYSREEELLPSPAALTQAAIMVGVPSSSGSPKHDQTNGPGDDVDAVLDALAGTLPVSTGDRAALAGSLRAALDTDGWDPDTLAGHLLAELPAVIRTRGLMTHRLSPTVLPDSPAVCSCSACRRHVTRTEAEIRRQAAAAERARQRAAATVDDTAERNRQTTEALGAELHGRIVAAADAAEYAAQCAARIASNGPTAPRPQRRLMTPGRARGLAAQVYAEHHHDLDAIRAYAGSLPAGPTETTAADGPSLTGAGGPIVRLRRAQGA